jgi:hypothetical protein
MKPCPRCGGDAEIERRIALGRERFRARCSGCKKPAVDWSPSKPDAHKAWDNFVPTEHYHDGVGDWLLALRKAQKAGWVCTGDEPPKHIGFVTEKGAGHYLNTDTAAAAVAAGLLPEKIKSPTGRQAFVQDPA